MRREDTLRILAEHRAEIDAFGVRSLAIFGSVARDEAGPESDVDILVEFDRPIGLFRFLELQEYLETILGRPVDLCTTASLKARIRDQVLQDAVRAG
jgi:predicted nucleotidyltransferase